MNENYTLTADSVQDSSSSQPTDVTDTAVQPAQHTADIPPTDIAHHKAESPRQPTGISFPTREYGTPKRDTETYQLSYIMCTKSFWKLKSVFRCILSASKLLASAKRSFSSLRRQNVCSFHGDSRASFQLSTIHCKRCVQSSLEFAI